MLLAPPLACGGQANKVGHGRTGHHDAGHGGGQAEEFFKPVQGLQFHLYAHWRNDPGIGDRFIGGREQICSHCGGCIAADDEMEAFWATGIGCGFGVDFQQLFYTFLSATAAIRQRLFEHFQCRICASCQGRSMVHAAYGIRQGSLQLTYQVFNLASKLFANRARVHLPTVFCWSGRIARPVACLICSLFLLFGHSMSL